MRDGDDARAWNEPRTSSPPACIDPLHHSDRGGALGSAPQMLPQSPPARFILRSHT